MDAIDAEILSVFPRRRIVAPDDVRGSYATLDAAVRHGGWPTLADSRGKVMFLMDNGEPYRSRYLVGRPALRGRIMFTNSVPGQPDAAFVKENDPTGTNLSASARRCGADTWSARAPTSTRGRLAPTIRGSEAQALASGAQWVSTDYPAPGMAARFGSSYTVRLPNRLPARCNPVNAPPGCRGRRLDRAATPRRSLPRFVGQMSAARLTR